MAVVLLDIDRFKALNDTYGHQAGDMVLVSVGDMIKKTLRSIDLPARMGGEEFAVLLPGEELDGAMLFAERLRKVLETTSVDYGGSKLSFTISFGVAGLPSSKGLSLLPADVAKQFEALKSTKDVDIAGILYSLADQALYKAKEEGRNRCRLADFKSLSEFKEVFPFDV